MNLFTRQITPFPKTRSVRPPLRFAAHTIAAGAAVMGALFLVGGCGSGGGTSPTPNPTPTPVATPDESITTISRFPNGLVLSLTLPKRTYAVGEAVPMTVTVQNTGTETASSASTISYYTNCTVRETDDRYGSIVDNFNESTGDAATKSASESRQWEPPLPSYNHTLAAGETRTFSLRWNQTYRRDHRTQVAPGTYYVRAEIGIPFTQYWNGIGYDEYPLTDSIVFVVQ